MQLRFKRWLMYLKNNKWEVYFYITTIAFLVLLWFMLFDFVMTKTYKSWIDKYDSVIAEKNAKLDMEYKDPKVNKFKLSEFVFDKENSVSWSKTISSLISIYEDLRKIDSQDSGLTLTDFKVTEESVQLIWEISDIKKVYITWGIIDKFISPDFVDTIMIPSYNKVNNNYMFNLDAKIKLNDDNRK